jgi:hypothetical protein
MSSYTDRTERQLANLQEAQFKSQEDLMAKRELNRDVAMSAMGKLLGSAQAYKIPDSVTKYANLMTALGGELSQLRDPSNKSSIDLSQYVATPTEYTPTPWNQIDTSNNPKKPGRTAEDLATMEKFRNTAYKGKNKDAVKTK